MRIFSPTETESSERRVAIVPASVTKLTALGAQVAVEAGIGASVNFSDAEYRDAGAEIVADRGAALASADIVLRLRKPPVADIAALKRACIHVSFLDPFTDAEPVRALAAAGVSAICMEMIPRSTIAQKMDALSSQASLAGYVAVLMGANRLDRIFPMMMTPAGTIPPAKVFVIGVGVAGLQAIATAKRLGAVVEAFDTRPEVEEQVKSLGGKFVKVDLGETGRTAQGYAKELTPEQLAKQREVMEQRCAQADLVITTAQVFGRKAPVIITKAMLEKMKPGTIVVDMAVESGGNVECSRPDEDIVVNGVKIIGWRNLAGRVPRAASAMYSSNLTNLVDHFWDRTSKTFRLDPANEILRDCLVTHDGAIVNERIRTLAL
ncbi:MAG: Re/Si-specific NAD(P)(+) transhydrogenase subunit alpha [Verrucomicrobia bacterium]|nr:Re/Si-specific NAD(P)(+) transhydrogenase subunit alpha [Verrucomicrobiota bacterium]